MKDYYPHMLECFLLVARAGSPPFPDDEPVAKRVVNNLEELEKAKKELIKQYPGGWLIQTPFDER